MRLIFYLLRNIILCCLHIHESYGHKKDSESEGIRWLEFLWSLINLYVFNKLSLFSVGTHPDASGILRKNL